jgi:hypothetical protein
MIKRLRSPKTQAAWLTLAATVHCAVTGNWLVYIGPAFLVIHSYLQDAVMPNSPRHHGQQR